MAEEAEAPTGFMSIVLLAADSRVKVVLVLLLPMNEIIAESTGYEQDIGTGQEGELDELNCARSKMLCTLQIPPALR